MKSLHKAGASALAGLLLLMVWSAQAAADDRYAAIAFSQDSGADGYGNDYGSRSDAEGRALGECGNGCQVVLWFRNACGALAVGEDNGYGTGWASSRRAAENTAMSNCNSNAAGCSIKRWVCTTR
jgi:hypothetical protein